MKKNIFLVIIILLALGSCKRNSDKENNKSNSDSIVNINIKDSNEYKTNNITTENSDSIIIDSLDINYSNKTNKCSVFLDNEIPSPSEFVYAVDKTKPNFDNLFPLRIKYKYNNTFQKSMVLGIISADMIYSLAYENANLTTKYFNAAMVLSDDLGLSNVFTHEDLKIVRNFENQDTINEIIEKSLELICIQLNESKAYNELPFVVYGGWIEAVYLLTNTLVNNPDSPKRLFKELAKQKTTIKNLNNFFNNILVDADDYETNLNIQSIIGELETVSLLFENSLRNKSYVMDKKQMNEIIDALNKIRNSITKETNLKIEQQQKQKYQKSLEK